MNPVPKPNNPSALRRVRTLSYLLDNAIRIPGTRHRIGLDPLIGLLTGGGDIAGAILSAYIILEATRFGLPRKTLMQMLGNLLTDSIVGSLPLIGDLFDVTWKANTRNLALLEAHVANPQPQRAADRGFIFFVIALLVLIVVGVAAVTVLVVNLLFRALHS